MGLKRYFSQEHKISANKPADMWKFYVMIYNTWYILVMQSSLVVYHGILHQSLEFSSYAHEPLGECVYQENTSDKWDIPSYTTRERCTTILYHAIENTVANTINAIFTRRLGVIPSNIQRLSCIVIDCIFYGMV